MCSMTKISKRKIKLQKFMKMIQNFYYVMSDIMTREI